MSLANVEVGREDVAQSQRASTSSRLQRQYRRRIAVDVLVAFSSPLLSGDVEIEGLGRVGIDLVRELVRNLLDKELSGNVGRTRDVGEGNVSAKWESGGILNGLGLLGRGSATGRLLSLELHFCYSHTKSSLCLASYNENKKKEREREELSTKR